MSLFPAYAGALPASTSTSTPTEPLSPWLENASFQIDITGTTSVEQHQPQTVEIVPPVTKRLKKSKKHKQHKEDKPKPPTPPPRSTSTAPFSIDTKRTTEFLTVQTISRPAVPRYHIKFYATSHSIKHRKRKLKRYYHTSSKKPANEDDEPKLTKTSLEQLGGSNPDENFTGFKQEEELSQQTAVYNKALADDPQDVKTWLEYVNFQDTVYQFEKTYRKGSIAKGLRVLGERKLSILDKALSLNPGCEPVLRERLDVAVGIYPADELQAQLRALVDKDQGNIILWQGYIEATQCSMSHCNTPAVVALYARCLAVLHRLRRSATVGRAALEESILRMLYQCGLFMKQAGLFEQLWTLLRLYLELNLAPSAPQTFNIASPFEERQLVELEEVVFASRLPLHELWLRTEKLRESCHWLPFAGEAECEDPQRLVFPEDVAELIHPITMPTNTFKLIAAILTLMKVPLLPCRHSTMQEVGLDYVSWSMDSIEFLLPLFYNSHPIDLHNPHFVIDPRLAVGPQYLNVLPGQEEYLDFVLATMKNCADCLTGNDKTACTIWWLRFQRLLATLEKDNRFKLPANYRKKIKTNTKNLLKLDENRNNVYLYYEYAMIEKELGNTKSCISIIETALSSCSIRKITTGAVDDQQVSRCFLVKSLVNLLLHLNEDRKALNKVIEYVLARPAPVEDGKELQAETALRLKHVTLQLLQQKPVDRSVAQHFLPDFLTDWLTLNGWFLYLTEGALPAGKFLESALQELEETGGAVWQREVLYEVYVCVFYRHCTQHPGAGLYRVLDDVLSRAIEAFPNNLLLLAVLGKLQSVVNATGCPWWKLKARLLKTGRAFAALFLVIVGNQQIVEAQTMVQETGSGRKFEMNDSWKNRMLALFRRITRSTRRCGLIWRLYLQFVNAYFDSTLCRNVYYTAVEECPWMKALYIDAAIYIPAELAQIQDLIIEKQLRLHVTPEELDVLRS